MRAGRWGAVVLGLALAAGCQPKAETPEQVQARIDSESASVRRSIDSLTREFTTHFNAGHGDLVAAFYTAQAHLMPPNQAAAVGPEAIKTAFAPFFAMKAELTLVPDAVVANGPVAVERGSYSVKFSPPGSPAPVTETGKYLVHWQRIDGKWLIADDIWNSDQPIPAGPTVTP
jgi:ketosteroid isomerase-like protein